MKLLVTFSMLSVFLLGMSTASAQGVVESSPAGSGRGQSTAELFYKIQQLEQDIMSLRGIVEEQDHQLRRLSKQRLDDYVNLDKRISALSGGSAIPSSNYSRPQAQPASARSATRVSPAVAPSAAAALPTLPSGDPGSEKAAYQAAYDLVKRQEFDSALSAFKDFVLLYPKGEYAANAYYWLGELHLYSADLNKAIVEFTKVVEQYPRHRKAADALFKLGKAHHVRGDVQTSRIMLNRVISDYGSSSSAKLARDYLGNELR